MSSAHPLKRPATVVAEIYQFYLARPHTAQLLVEGFDDRRLFGKFVDHRSCRLDFAGNKESALDVLKRLNQLSAVRRGVKGFLVAVDADFDPIFGKQIKDPNLIYTDAHSTECMLFRDADLRALLVEFGLSPQDTPSDLMVRIERQAQKIGLLRLVNEKHQLHLNFKNLDVEIDTLFSTETVDIDFRSLTARVLQMSHPTRVKPEQLTDYLKQLPKILRWHAVNGHDLMELLASYLRQKTGDPKITDSRVAAVLRICYTASSFEQTRTYADIRSWEQRNPGYVVLGVEAPGVNNELASGTAGTQ